MSKTINVLITIDTDLVISQNPSPSTAANEPTTLTHDFTYGFMVVSGTTVNSGQGTALLNFNALVGDTVRFFAVSGSNNFEAAVLLYGLPRYQDDQVLSPFAYMSFTRSAVKPGTPNPLPPTIVNEQFWFFQANVIQPGSERFLVQFGLYRRDLNGQLALYGYFQWDPTISVAG